MTLPDRPLRLAAACYPIEAHRSWNALDAKLSGWVQEAQEAGAQVAVLPEYAGLEAALVAPPSGLTPPEWCQRSADGIARYVALCATLAQRHRLWLLSGSAPTRVGTQLANRAFLCRPDGGVHAVDKQVLTPWEAQHTPLAPGPSLPALQAGPLCLATLICYDNEFPPLAQALAPDVLLMPACTEAPAGDTRLRVAAQARALELQAITVHAPLIGAVPGCALVDENTGRAGIFAPPDAPFPNDGVLALGTPDTPGWVFAEVPSGALSETRNTGAVAPRADMARAFDRAGSATRRIVPQLAP